MEPVIDSPTPELTFAGASVTLPPGYTLSVQEKDNLQALGPAGETLQLRSSPTGLPAPALALLRRNRDMFLQVLSAQAPALVKQAVEAKAAAQSEIKTDGKVETSIVSIAAGSAIFASTSFSVGGAPFSLVLWLLPSAAMDAFIVISLASPGAVAEAPAKMAPLLASLRLT